MPCPQPFEPIGDLPEPVELPPSVARLASNASIDIEPASKIKLLTAERKKKEYLRAGAQLKTGARWRGVGMEIEQVIDG
jgi:hypothetical protein